MRKSAPSKTAARSADRRPVRPRAGLTRVRRVDLVQEVVSRLRQEILTGQLTAETPLPSEGKLCLTLGVSRTVVREAMRILRAQGLVEVSQGRRPRVKPADPQDAVQALGTFLRRSEHSLLDLIEVRMPLETEIAALAAQRATPTHFAALEEAVRRMVRSQRLDEQIAADIDFHNVLAEATGNAVFQLLMVTLAGLMRESRRLTLSRTGLDRANEGHRAVLAAVRQADADEARRAMCRHLSMAQEDLRGEGE
jgi:GntR family transcriptional repressor for pyruvate dehydrogenase complex